MTIQAEVFPREPDRWIAVIDPSGAAFSIEVPRPGLVLDEVKASIEAVLSVIDPQIELVDDRGRPWSAAGAEEQMRRLNIDFAQG